MNPSVKDDCSGMNLGTYYCLSTYPGGVPAGQPGDSSSTTETMTITSSSKSSMITATGEITTPSTVQTGIVSNCDKFYDVVSDDGCYDIAIEDRCLRRTLKLLIQLEYMPSSIILANPQSSQLEWRNVRSLMSLIKNVFKCARTIFHLIRSDVPEGVLSTVVQKFVYLFINPNCSTQPRGEGWIDTNRQSRLGSEISLVPFQFVLYLTD